MRKIIILWISVFLLFISASNQIRELEADGQNVLEIIKILADDSMQGRMSGTEGGRRATRYIINKFKEWDIEPAGEKGTFYQKFDLKDFFMVEPGTKLEISYKKRRHRFHQYYHREEWQVLKYSGSGEFEAEIVFAGYGIHAPECGYDSYDGIDIKNKIALISFGYPLNKDLREKLGKAVMPEERVKAACKLGAKAVMVMVHPIQYSSHSYPFMYDLDQSVYNADFVMIGINQKILEFILDEVPTSTRELFGPIDRTGKPRSFHTGWKADICVRTVYDKARETANVLGKIPGKDPQRKNEYVILSAHMDHMGVSPEHEVINGANDNASGTALVMEIARLIKINRIESKRTLVFALWAAEELAPCLLGSKHYAEHLFTR